MTINTWRNEILNTCKYCKHFTGKGKWKWCDKYNRIIYEVGNCCKTESIWKQMPSDRRPENV